MKRVDFYVVPPDDDNPMKTACRLCEKAVNAGKRVHVHIPDAARAQAFDKALWSFRQGSFIAHERLDAVEDEVPLAPVLIGDGEPHADHADVLLNLGDEIPAFYRQFERVLEIVHGADSERSRSRARFKHYREQGCTLETHKL